MARTRTTKLEKTLNEIKRRGGLAPREIVTFLLQLQGLGKKSANAERQSRRTGQYNAVLYGTFEREGILERFCRKGKDGKFRVTKKIQGPFTPVRPEPRPYNSPLSGTPGLGGRNTLATSEDTSNL